MSSPTFYWYPDPAGRLVKTDLGELLSDLQIEPIVEAEDAYDGSGVMYRSFLAAGWRVRIILERFRDPDETATSALERELLAMGSHLQRGGSVGFALLPSQVWASIARRAPGQGDTALSTLVNGFSAWEVSGAIAQGDEVVIESAPPDQYFEVAIAAGASTIAGVTIESPGTLFTYGSKPLVRHRDFWPMLHLPQDQLQTPIVTSDRRLVWTMDITLEYRVASVLALWGDSVTNAPLLLGTTTTASSGTAGRGLTGPDLVLDSRIRDAAVGGISTTPYSTRWL